MLSQSVSASGSAGYSGLVSASFSANIGFRQAKEEMAKGSNTKIFSTASCDYYYGVINPRQPPPLTKDAKNWLLQMLEMIAMGSNHPATNKEVVDFLAIYGTHIVTEMKLGAKFVIERTIQTQELTKIESRSTDVSASASVSGSYAGFSG